MVYLVWDSADFGGQFKRAGEPEVRARYASLAEAKAQAKHDLTLGRHPLRIEDARGKVLWEAANRK